MSKPAPSAHSISVCRGVDVDACRFAMPSDEPIGELLEKAVQESGWAEFLDRTIIGPLLHHHTFKIAVSACPNGCSRPHVADVGLIRACVPQLDPKPCTSCSICFQVCPDKAIAIGDLGPEFDESLCMQCGLCVKKCPEQALMCKEQGYRIVLGGKLGRHPRLATELSGIFSAEDAIRVTRSALSFYMEHYRKGLRFGTLLDERCDEFFDMISEN